MAAWSRARAASHLERVSWCSCCDVFHYTSSLVITLHMSLITHHTTHSSLITHHTSSTHTSHHITSSHITHHRIITQHITHHTHHINTHHHTTHYKKHLASCSAHTSRSRACRSSAACAAHPAGSGDRPACTPTSHSLPSHSPAQIRRRLHPSAPRNPPCSHHRTPTHYSYHEQPRPTQFGPISDTDSPHPP